MALGAVIRGDSYYFEIVANESASGLASVQLDLDIPIGNGILITQTEKHARVRARDKGRNVALAALEVANLLAGVRKLAK